MTDIIISLTVEDIRFPTSLEKDGSDAMNKAPDYSCPYVSISTQSGISGNGITFTVGRGNNIVCEAIKLLSHLVVGQDFNSIVKDFGTFWRTLTSEDQIRWLGPEKGVMHLAVAAITNAIWDMWAKRESKPLWKLLVDLEPEQLVSTIDFRYITDSLTKEEAISILTEMKSGKAGREEEMKLAGYPAYTTSCAWLGYSDDKIERLCKEAQAQGFTRFKMKVGSDLEDDKRRAKILRQTMGPDNLLMVDANQKWEVQEAIDWMRELVHFNITWIEEPTSPDDVLGHAEIAKALKPLGIGVATGEQCQNRVMFKQFLKAGAMQFCQIDSCRLGGVSENIAVILLAKKYGVPVCPHAGGVGLCEYVQHLSIFDYICVSGSLEKRMIEYTDHLHEHFETPCKIRDGCYIAPEVPGYSIDMKQDSRAAFCWPDGHVWRDLIQKGLYKE
ncbi:mitochondrial enolase superfamily member 1-like isoform X1 [Biomphalaria glabrata]|uniref:Mitochondrial enolase superfamily member 1 n=1 Tax=Biomphalaria glabrata TaxID=6526 RepID=A0A9W3AAZ2_BIOGL|nr:mitochondrial enolase superfamily member 1-like isoform X1 [Biomphalaria glabrata]XP_055884341.1 mitochondrial enolase superfamily member 1-like isoform X1 [Biomphalaria glabrata]XP_055884342.1 mitochondrial enolase superfamily member 1-like isoform X1 [Biomphalaria glabrata]XP_055884343.1 mitochondrial enolase superfamily member 1-like isoform X1 [Biomphalaria glabrata]